MRALGWAVPLCVACSVYEPSLLDGAGIGGSGSGGTSSASGGDISTNGGSSNGGMGDVTGGSVSESGGKGAGGNTSSGGTGPDEEGGGPSGGTSATGGTVSAKGGASATGGTVSAKGGASAGGSPATGGTVSAKGGASATGGTSGGAPVSTGGTGGCSTDSDGDGSDDCADACPDDPAKIAPGTCGCGIPDEDNATSASCVGLKEALVHRYSFAGTGSKATDTWGTAHGTVVNATLAGAGSLTLAGGTSDQYVDLPNGILSSLEDASIDVWMTWNGGNSWQRIFDFGSTATEGVQGGGLTYLFLTARTAERGVRVSYTTSGTAGETFVNVTRQLVAGQLNHFTVVVDDRNDLLSLYLNGVVAGTVAFTGALGDIDDINNWLGRSQYSTDPELSAVLHEVRIYGAALDAKQVMASEIGGADPSFF